MYVLRRKAVLEKGKVLMEAAFMDCVALNFYTFEGFELLIIQKQLWWGQFVVHSSLQCSHSVWQFTSLTHAEFQSTSGQFFLTSQQFQSFLFANLARIWARRIKS